VSERIVHINPEGQIAVFTPKKRGLVGQVTATRIEVDPWLAAGLDVSRTAIEQDVLAALETQAKLPDTP